MKRRTLDQPLRLVHLLALLTPTVHAATVQPRWGHSSVLLSPSSQPILTIVSGKAFQPGQTSASTPTTTETLFLNLSSPILDLSSPPWITTTTSLLTSYGSALALTSGTALLFGGDATGDVDIPLQTNNDSSWLLSFPADIPNPYQFTSSHLQSNSLGQPARREQSLAVSASNGTLSRAWVFGGIRADGSTIASNELWEFSVPVTPSSGVAVVEQGLWGQVMPKGTAPPPLYDGRGVLVTEEDGSPSIWFLGGVDGTSSALTPLASIPVFHPSRASSFEGTWEMVTVSSSYVPAARRGHVAVGLGEGKIWIQGGKSLDGLQVLNDAAVLDTRALKWEKTSDDGVAVWGHSAAMVGESVVLTFGYGLDAPVTADLRVYIHSNNTWVSSYHPSFVASPSPPAPNPTYTAPGGAGSPSSTNALPLPTSAVVNTGSPSASTGWTVPGVLPNPTAPSSSPTEPSNTDDKSDDSPPSKKLVVSAVLGSLGAVALVLAGGILLVRQRRRRPTGSRFGGAGGWRRMSGDGEGSIMTESGHPRRWGTLSSTPEYALPQAGPPGRGGVQPVERQSRGVGRAFSGFWRGSTASVGGGRGDPRRRVNMLSDEVSEPGLERWTMFDADEGETSPDAGASTRAGPEIWKGYRNERAERASGSSGSFLSAALGVFTPLNRQGSLEDFYREADVTPMSDLGHPGLGQIDEEDGDATSSGHFGPSRESFTPSYTPSGISFPHSNSTGALSQPDVTVQTGNTFGRRPAVSSPAPPPLTSLHGSSFGASSGPSDDDHSGSLNRRSTWWARLAKPLVGSGGADATGSGGDYGRIRDPAPAPSLDYHGAENPFSDESAALTSGEHVDEEGRTTPGAKSKAKESSLGTVDSARLEEAMLGMVVIQRDSSMSSDGRSIRSRSEEGKEAEERLAFLEPVQPSSPIDVPNLLPGVFDERSSMPSASLASSETRFRARGPRPMINTASLPLVDDYPASPTKIYASPLSATPTRSTGGVRAIVQQFERQSSLLVDTPTSPLPGSSGLQLSSSETSKEARSEQERPRVLSAGETSAERVKAVRHGLAKRPTLYVANPDTSDVSSSVGYVGRSP